MESANRQATEPSPAIRHPASFATGRYQVVRLLGEGARKRVYCARDTRLDREVAIAVLKQEGLDRRALDRLSGEARTIARLGDHPAIAAVYDVGEEDGTVYVVGQYMAGGDLDTVLRERGGRPLPIVDALRIAESVCSALAHAHANGVVHRDVKPANVWLTGDGTAKLGDFGLASSAALSRPQDTQLRGTVPYIAPEQIIGDAVDARADLYSVGAVIYEMLTGEPPFVGQDAAAVLSQHVNREPVPPSRRNAEVTGNLEELVLKLLAKSPATRPQTAAVVTEALHDILSSPATAAAKVSASGLAAAEPSSASVFVGRTHELDQLRGSLDAVFRGRGQLFMLAGEAGVGKTRTAEQIAGEARAGGARVLVGRCYGEEGAPAYWPWIQILRTYVHDSDPTTWTFDMGDGVADIAQVVPDVRERLPGVAAPQHLEPEHARFRLFDAIALFLRRAARRYPILLILDDLHWADKASLLLLQFLAHEIAEARIMVLGTYRDVDLHPGHPLLEIEAALARERVHRRMLLRGLSEDDVRALLAARGARDVPQPFVHAIFRESEGNPFFVEELLRHLVEERIVQDLAQWTGVSPPEIGIPDSIREVIRRRLRRLPKDCVAVLTIASVLGREFSIEALARVGDVANHSRQDLRAFLDEAVAARVMTEVRGAVGRYSFSHALIRETLYGELLTSARLRYHRQVAEMLEGLIEEGSPSHRAELSYHFFEALRAGGDVEKAIQYAREAGDGADAQLAYEEATTQYERALQALDLKMPPEPARRSELLLTLGKAYLKVGDFRKSKEAFRHAASLAGDLKAPELFARAALGLGGFFASFEFGVVGEELIGLLEEALALLPPGDSAMRASVTARLAAALIFAGSPQRRLALANEAVTMARHVGDRATLSLVLARAHWAIRGPDNLPERLGIAAEMVEIAEEIGDAPKALEARFWNAEDLFENGDFENADREMEEFCRIAERSREPFRLWEGSILRARRALRDGELAEAEELALGALRVGREAQNPNAVQTFGAQIFPIRREQGRLGETEAEVRSFVRQYPTIPSWRCAFALLLLETGREAEAREELERLAREDFDDIPRDAYWLTALHYLTELCTALGDARRAARLYEMLEPYGDRVVVIPIVAFLGTVSRLLGLLAATLGRSDDAKRHLERALEAHERLGAPGWRARTRYDAACALLGSGVDSEHARAIDLLDRAIDEARRTGMNALLERALAAKLRAQGIAAGDLKSSIEAVARSVERERPDLRSHAAPDGTVTILFSDIEGFTAMTERLGDREAHKLIQAHNTIVRKQLAAYEGFEVERLGDGFLLAFSSARQALRCAIGMQRAFAEHNAGNSEPLRVRIGLHTGEAIKEVDRFFGKTVILAARITAQACGAEILVSSLLRELVDGAAEFAFDEGREAQLKGLAGTHRMYGVIWDPSVEGRAPARTTPPPAGGDNSFRKSGDYWQIRFERQSLQLHDAKGLHYIRQLLSQPGRDVHVLDLVTQRSAEPSPLRAPPGEGGSAGLASAAEILDPKARAEYRSRIEELRGELEEASGYNDVERASRIRQELEFVARELSAAYGIGGRARKVADASERARKAVTNRIRDTIAKLDKDNPTLARHLANSIRLGTFCSYTPERPVEWDL